MTKPLTPASPDYQYSASYDSEGRCLQVFQRTEGGVLVQKVELFGPQAEAVRKLLAQLKKTLDFWTDIGVDKLLAAEDRARNSALEDAAQKADEEAAIYAEKAGYQAEEKKWLAMDIAAAIRDLKGPA